MAITYSNNGCPIEANNHNEHKIMIKINNHNEYEIIIKAKDHNEHTSDNNDIDKNNVDDSIHI